MRKTLPKEDLTEGKRKIVCLERKTRIAEKENVQQAFQGSNRRGKGFNQDYSSQVQKQKTDTGAYVAWAMCIKSDRKGLCYPKIQKMITYNRVGF